MFSEYPLSCLRVLCGYAHPRLRTTVLQNRLTDGGDIVSLMRRRLLPPGRFPVLISVRGWVDPKSIVWLEGLVKLKNPMASEIEPVPLALLYNERIQMSYFIQLRSDPALVWLQWDTIWKQLALVSAPVSCSPQCFPFKHIIRFRHEA
jgi:hypothetical protein